MWRLECHMQQFNKTGCLHSLYVPVCSMYGNAVCRIIVVLLISESRNTCKTLRDKKILFPSEWFILSNKYENEDTLCLVA